MLRWTRICAESTLAAIFTVAVLDSTVASMSIGRWIQEVQLVPAVLSMSGTVILLWFTATILFGRIYCSTICPMGVLMDAVARLRITFSNRPYRYTAPRAVLRLAMLGLFVALLLTGATGIASLIEPSEAYSRVVTYLIKPAGISALSITVAVTTLVAVTWIAALHGRSLCNTICPTGTFLGICSQGSLFHFDIDTDRCTQCRQCADVCKARCIDLNDHTVDMSRCVVCFNCTAVCPDRAITYTTRRHRLATPMMLHTSGNRMCNQSTAATTTSTNITDNQQPICNNTSN